MPHASAPCRRPVAIIVCVLLCGLAFTPKSSLHADETVPAAKLYRQARDAGVEILVDGRQAGSGCLVSADGLILTAAHVIPQPNQRAEVLAPSLGRVPAQLVAVDLGHDLMLLQAATSETELPHLMLAKTTPDPGETVFLFSSAVFRHAVMQRGMVAREGVTFEHQGHFIEVTHIAAMVQEGTSGGPWLNALGEVIGVQSGSVTTRTGPGGIANVAPLAAIQSLVENRVNANTPTLSLFVDEFWILPVEMLRRFPPQTEGVVIQAFQNDGPAGKAGLKTGEVITTIDDRPIRYRDDFVKGFRAKKPGEAITITVVSPDGTGVRTVSITLGQLEVGWPNRSQSE